MSHVLVAPELVQGDFLTRNEFLRRWEASPNLKRAELIRGVVYVPSPLSLEHGRYDYHLGGWLAVYEAATPGCMGCENTTWLMGDEDTLQPDKAVCILPEYGGQCRVEGKYPVGAPEFLAEVSLSSTSYDLNQKLDVYEECGVQEYLAVLGWEDAVRWHYRIGGKLEVSPAPSDGVYRSRVFPGLWLHAGALLARDLPGLLATLQEGLASPEHAAFVAALASRLQSGSVSS